MEVAACERLIRFLLSKGVDIRAFATDRSISIRKMIKTLFPNLRHEFDPWLVNCIKLHKKMAMYVMNFRHYVKGIEKSLYKSSKLKSCQNLNLWQKSISTMIWWALGTSIGEWK